MQDWGRSVSRGIVGISIFVSIAAATFWVLDFCGKWDDWGIPAGHDAAVASLIAAVILWLSARRSRRADQFLRSMSRENRRREGAMIKIADRISGAPTGPHPRHP